LPEGDEPPSRGCPFELYLSVARAGQVGDDYCAIHAARHLILDVALRDR
jgi:hypothetical protein